MIPDFPTVKHQLNKLMANAITHQIREISPMMQRASKKILFEGNKMAIQREDGEFELSEMEKVEAMIQLEKDELLNLTPEQLDEKMQTMANEMAIQLTSNVLSEIDKAVKKTGNSISSPNGLTIEWIHEATRRIKISFEDDDINKPVELVLIASPEVCERLKMEEESLTDSQKVRLQKEYKEIIEQKYKEHLADLESRRLIMD